MQHVSRDGATMPGPKVFVEALDRAFENVCELDLVFHFDEVGMPWSGYFALC